MISYGFAYRASLVAVVPTLALRSGLALVLVPNVGRGHVLVGRRHGHRVDAGLCEQELKPGFESSHTTQNIQLVPE
jgi:hypothetical protein